MKLFYCACLWYPKGDIPTGFSCFAAFMAQKFLYVT